ncbi:MAG: NAD(P)/FAD-dependent oxidoreductase [Hydrocarboniphaga sp.]|uniref:flavin-containing monooxygenase n=1 Tax=Hydrocarboniphaga sp. TaxID=2033016 RepID=UPI002634EC23|nr:NAD(P)/FAD-dependent oxidoreductase [Hydrocarboniphaga sp.]MDB5971259.1 NAD(P)/FAD-dependent oxidoreductase [Hydrocarboniphaga sp.]
MKRRPPSNIEHFDVLIVGAGLSGIDAAYRLQSECSGKHYAILEARDALGGTWDLFRYPGIRADSDMYTLGFPFRPWRGDISIAPGDAIRDYIRETAEEYGIDRKIRFGHCISRAAWSSETSRWTVEGTAAGKPFVLSCSFLSTCCGYYDYAQGYTPEFDGIENFSGQLLHPQQWPDQLDLAGKRVVVIGSGATAVTLIPSLAAQAARVTMLQRSPSYIVAMPAKDRIANWMRDKLPGRIADALARWKNLGLAILLYQLAQRRPERIRKALLQRLRRQLGPAVDVDTHFSPAYKPWDQRLCLAPDGDLFKVLRSGQADIVTDHIQGFVENGIRLRSGRILAADIVVTATGLNIKLMGGIELLVDGEPVKLADKLIYKGMMLSDVPNLAFAFGYTNASWTLKCDLSAGYVCRLLNHMDRKGYQRCTPRPRDAGLTSVPMSTLRSGYLLRARGLVPRQGSRAPWRVHQNYVIDLAVMKYTRVDDGVMEFGKAA